MDKKETNNWEAFALFNMALNKIENYKQNRDFNELEDAKKKLDATIGKDPTFTLAFYHLAILYDLMGEHEEAVENLLKLLKSEYRLDALYALGVAYFHQYTYKVGMYDKAIYYFKQLLDELKKKRAKSIRDLTFEILSHAGLANVYAHLTIKKPMENEMNFNKEAEKYFDLTLKECENAEILLKKKKLKEPETINDIHWLILNANGVALMYKGKRENNKSYIQEAIERFSSALNFSTNTNLLSNLGTAYIFLFDLLKETSRAQAEEYLSKAIDYFENKVLMMRPHYDFAYYRLARSYRKRGDFSNALKFIELAEKYRSEVSLSNINEEKQKILNNILD